jgi:hypothetical protein
MSEPELSFDQALVRASLSQAIGPCPWYVTDRPCSLRHGSLPLHFEAPLDDSLYGPHTLLCNEQDVYGVFKTPTVVGQLEGNRLVIAHRRQTPPTLALIFVEADTMKPLENPGDCRNHLASDQRRFFFHPETPVTKILLPRRVQPGTHVVRFPKSLSDLSEFLIVSYLATDPHYPENRQAAIYCVNPILGQVQIVALDWFNHSDEWRHDGTQWITRAAREPLSGRIVGEGIRMGQFVLTEDTFHVDHWLQRSDSFVV